MRWKKCWWPSGQRRDGLAAAVLMLIEELRVELPGQLEQAEDVEIRERQRPR
jgi:hypothetical protein